MEQIIAELKTFILAEFLPGEDPEALTPTTPLVSGGIIDSLATLRLVSHLEETYGAVLEPHELTVEYLETLNDIAALVQSKR